MKCFYHSADLDGHCSGALVKLRYPECRMFPIDYGEQFPWDVITDKEETVYMVDFSLPIKDMLHLNSICKLIWIDHHKSAIEAAAEYPRVNFNGHRDVLYAACELVWYWVASDDEGEMPEAVRLLGRYDVWDHSDPETLPFQMGMRIHDTNPINIGVLNLWERIFDPIFRDLYETRDVGIGILKYQDQVNKKYLASHAFETIFGGLRCIAVNGGQKNSLAFGEAINQYPICIYFTRSKDHLWTVSLYSNRPEVDVSAIAKKHGGGGHSGAAGFLCKELPFEI